MPGLSVSVWFKMQLGGVQFIFVPSEGSHDKAGVNLNGGKGVKGASSVLKTQMGAAV